MRMRQSPSTSTRTVLSGNLSIFRTRPAQPNSCKSSGVGLSNSGLRCRTSPRRRSPSTTSSMRRMLWAVSTSNGATMPGKITISERPRMGRTEGTLAATRGVCVSVPPGAAPKIRMNSVSGEVICRVALTLDAPSSQKVQQLFFFGNRNEDGFCRRTSGLRDIDAEKPVLVGGLGLTEVVAGWNFNYALEGAVIDFHDQEFTFGAAAAVRPLTAD